MKVTRSRREIIDYEVKRWLNSFEDVPFVDLLLLENNIKKIIDNALSEEDNIRHFLNNLTDEDYNYLSDIIDLHYDKSGRMMMFDDKSVEVRNKTISFDVTEIEQFTIQQMAEDRGMSMNRMILKLLDLEYKDPMLLDK